MTPVRRLGLGLVVLLAVLLVVDRVGVAVAEDRVAQRLQDELALRAAPDVGIHGFPVLTQAIAGRYDEVTLALAAADLGDLSDLDVTVRLSGLRIPLSHLFSEQTEPIPVEGISGSVAIPYAQLAAQVGAGVTVRNSAAGVVVTATLDVLGQQLDVSGTGRIRVESSDQIGVTVVGLDLAGLEIPAALVEQLQGQLSFTYTVPTLPFGLRITGVVATDEGVRVSAAAEDTVLRPL